MVEWTDNPRGVYLMFEWMTRFDVILVTGPQRSGTRICARMVAHDTGYRYVDERVIAVGHAELLVALSGKFVAQCPALCYCIHELGADNIAIVLMRRSITDIMASQERINWGNEADERRHYPGSVGPISVVKYEFWEQHQRPLIDHPFEIEYESLASHPLWIPKEGRSNFVPDQWK
jgi:hypothetical protein